MVSSHHNHQQLLIGINLSVVPPTDTTQNDSALRLHPDHHTILEKLVPSVGAH